MVSFCSRSDVPRVHLMLSSTTSNPNLISSAPWSHSKAHKPPQASRCYAVAWSAWRPSNQPRCCYEITSYLDSADKEHAISQRFNRIMRLKWDEDEA